jgi:acyl-CoA thioester hydrolase
VGRPLSAARESSSARINEVKLRVRYAETDQMGVVYHSNFLVWMEIGRVEFMRALGFDYKSMEVEDDCHLPVVEVRCRYKSPAHYDDCVVIRTELRKWRSSLVHFSYEIVRETDDALLAEAETIHIPVNSRMEKRLLPERFAQRFASVSLATIPEDSPAK